MTASARTSPARTGTVPRRTVRGVLAAVLTAVMVVSALPAAAASSTAPVASADQTFTVEGSVATVVVDGMEDQPRALGDPAPVERRLEVDGRLFTLPGLEVFGPSARVTVTLTADEGMTPTEALLEVVDGGPRATLVDVTAAPEHGTERAPTARLSTGVHTLVVLPVHWGAPDSNTRVSLQQAADKTAAYWRRQSNGLLNVSTSVRDWVKIPYPGDCSTMYFEDNVMASALAAHGVAGPNSSGRHVAVYFPEVLSCGYGGQAMLDGGAIWLNGPGGGTTTPAVDYTHYVLAHEFGHNLGLGHANTLECWDGTVRVPYSEECYVYEYGDNTDVMGQGNLFVPGNLSAAFGDQLGYTRTQTVGSPTVTASTVSLAPTASFGALRALKFPMGSRTLYVEYRPAVAPDVQEPGWAGVQVRIVEGGPGGFPESFLLDMQPQPWPGTQVNLPVGAAWTIPGANTAVTTRATNTGGAQIVIGPAGATLRIQRYVQKVYRDLFERAVDPSGLQTWTTALLNGTPRVAVANSITYSNEYRSRLITASYRYYLGRSPDAPGLQHWLRTMAAGYTIQRMEAGFLASPEYYAKAGSTPQGWVRELYRHVLGRGAAPAEVTHWTGVLARGGSRNTVAIGFLLSTEHLTTVVDGYYQDLLGRGIDPSGRRTWVGKIQAGHRVEAIIGGIIASEEYFAKS